MPSKHALRRGKLDNTLNNLQHFQSGPRPPKNNQNKLKCNFSMDEPGTQEVSRMALRGGVAKLLSQAGNFALRLSFMIILARLLEPEDFGLVAMVTVVTAFLDLFTTAGLSMAAVQKSTINNEQISMLFWINLLVGITLAVICLLIAPLLVAFYHEPRLFWMTAAVGVGFIFNAAGAQHVAMLQRRLRYVVLAAIEFSCQLISLSIGIIVALAGYRYWALVAAAVSLPACMTISVWTATAWIPGRPRHAAGVWSLLHFGGTITLNAVVSYATYNFDKFILGRVWGANALGYYGVASQLINIPTSNLNTAVGGVMFSALSRVQHDGERFKRYFLAGYSLNISLTLPITIFAAVFTDDIIFVVLGPKWVEAASLFRLLVPTVLVFGVVNPLGWLLWSSGRHVRSFQLSLLIGIVVVIACLIGLPYGPQGVAIGYSTAMLLLLVPIILWCLHGTTITPMDLFRTASRPLLSSAVAVALAFAADYALSSQPHFEFVPFVVEAVVMTIAYPCMLLFVMGQKRFYFDLLKGLTKSAPSADTP